MATFAVHEFNRDTCEPTGRVEYYSAVSYADAMSKVLYTRRLSGPAALGPTGRVVYAGVYGWTVTLEVNATDAEGEGRA